MHITANEIIKHRKNNNFNRTQQIHQRLHELELEEQELRHELELIIAENDMLDHMEGRGIIINTHRVGHKPDHLMFEDAVREIFENAGRPIRVKDLISELAKYGYTWSTIQKARYDISNSDLIEKASWGYVQRRRV
jgi:hypothetical protein